VKTFVKIFRRLFQCRGIRQCFILGIDRLEQAAASTIDGATSSLEIAKEGNKVNNKNLCSYFQSENLNIILNNN
jgi:hypothetical protein